MIELPAPRTYGMTYACQDGVVEPPHVLLAHPDRECMEREAAGGFGHVVPLYDADQVRAHVAAVRRQTLKDAAQAAGPEDSYQDEWFKAKADAVRRILALPGA